MLAADSYAEWAQAAILYDEKNNYDQWKKHSRSSRYDYVAIQRRLDSLRELRRQNDAHGLLFALNEGLHGNLGGIGSSALYEKARFGTKQLIVDYIDEVVSALEYLADPRVSQIKADEKLEFFDRAAHCFGRSALVLSGAGALFYFHLGVVKALWEQGLLPQVISGASGGALVAALVGTHTEDELVSIFDPAYIDLEVERESRLFKYFSLISQQQIPTDQVVAVIERLIPDLTFEEAQKRTGIHINIPVAPAEIHQKSRLLNATTSPNVLVREAVLASCAVPALYPAVTLAAKNSDGEKKPYLPSRRWIDGSIAEDLPLKRLARLYGVNHSIVSQTNALVLPFVNSRKDKQTFADILQEVSVKTAKEWTLALARISQKPLNKDSTLRKLVGSVMSVVSQTYTGDINILPSTRVYNPLRLMSRRTKEEALALIKDGERSTWPKIEMIRLQTRISRTLDAILQKQGVRILKLAREHSGDSAGERGR